MNKKAEVKADIGEEIDNLLALLPAPASLLDSNKLSQAEKEKVAITRACLNAAKDIQESEVNRLNPLPLAERTQRTSQEEIYNLVECQVNLTKGINSIYTQERLSEGEFLVISIAQVFLELFTVAMGKLGE